jgi:outer membrane protein assembly factor BamB
MSGITIKNFSDYETVPLTLVASTAATVAFALPASWGSPDVMVTNSGTTVAFVNFCNSSKIVNAQVPGTNGTLGATPVLGGETMILSKNKGATYNDTCCAISTGTPTLYFTSGVGS